MGIDAIFDTQNWAVVPFHFWSLVFFTFGCMVGSFLNVCIYRMPLDLSVVTPPSHCPHCKYAIPFYLNIPLVTWLALKGRCKNCRAPISSRYFVVELVTGLAFLSCWLVFGDPSHPLPSLLLALVYGIFLAGLICATFIDFEHFIIPDEVTLGGIGVGFAISFLLPALHGVKTNGAGMIQGFLGIAVGAGIIYAVLRLGKLLFGRQKLKLPPGTKIIFTETDVCLPDQQIAFEELFYRKSDAIVLHAHTLELVDRCYQDVTVRLSTTALQIGDEKINPLEVACLEAVSEEITLPREAMGFGDVKLMGAIGAFLGWQAVLFTVFVSSLLGSVVGLLLMAFGGVKMQSRIPFGPYLSAAALIWVFWGPALLEIYMKHLQR